MKANLSNVAKHFFPNPSLEMVYFEAIANSIDAEATEISINIKIKSFAEVDTFKLEISDNGNGFTDENFRKFSILMENESESHKGLGRLVYLSYFNKVEVSSSYEGNTRFFTLSDAFDGENNVNDTPLNKSITKLNFTGYTKDKIKSYDYLKPVSLKKSIVEHFYPLFYTLKSEGKELVIKINLDVVEANPEQVFSSETRSIKISELPELEVVEIPAEGLDLFENFQLLYSIKPTDDEVKPITALCVDGRTIAVDVLSKGGIPSGYEMIFLLYSNLFTGKVNPSRQELKMNDSDLKTTKRLFGKKIGELIQEAIPKIQEKNKETVKALENRYPHLLGYFNEEAVGLIDRTETLDNAQSIFFKAQKEILEASNLTDIQYEKSLDVSARLLTEYILYRNIIIDKIGEIDLKDSEAAIHNLIVPMRTSFKSGTKMNDVYNNNAWLLDDKYMSYTTILSDLEMTSLLKEIAIDDEQVESDVSRPDIAVVFSNNPNDSEVVKFDIVVVELKKLGLKLAKKEELVSQLKQRARKLLQHYPDRIQRIWFYGIIDFDDEFVRSLKEEDYLEVYSGGKYFYKESNIIPDKDKPEFKVPIGLNLISFDSLILDAKSRNNTFLEILKEGLKESVK